MSEVTRGLLNLKMIRDALQPLVHSIRNKRLPAVPSRPWNRRDYDVRDPVRSAQRWARETGDIFGLRSETTVTVSFGQTRESVAGHIELGPGSSFPIVIDENLRYDPPAVAAVLGHEIAHVFLHQHALKFSEDSQNEILTDCTAIFYGFGIVMADTYVQTETAYETSLRKYVTKRKLGYLTPDEVGYVQTKAAYMVVSGEKGLSDITPLKTYCASLENDITPAALKPFRSGQAVALNEFTAPRLADDSGKYIVFRCPMCVNPKKMRVPIGGTKKVWCPFCKIALLCVAA